MFFAEQSEAQVKFDTPAVPSTPGVEIANDSNGMHQNKWEMTHNGKTKNGTHQETPEQLWLSFETKKLRLKQYFFFKKKKDEIDCNHAGRRRGREGGGVREGMGREREEGLLWCACL